MSASTTNVTTSDAATPCGNPTTYKPLKRRWSRRVASDLVGAGDSVAIIIGAILPAAIYQYYGGLQADWALIIQSAVAATVVFLLCMKSWGMFDLNRMHDFPVYPERILTSLILALLLVVGLGLPKAIENNHLWVWYAVWSSASYTLLLGNRILAHFILGKMTAQGAFNQRVAVFGAGPIARRCHDFLANPALAIRFVGVFDDRMGEDRINPEGLEVAGKLNELIEASRRNEIDQIIVALPQQADSRIQNIVDKLKQLPVSIHIVTHISSDLLAKNAPTHKVSSIGPVGLLDVKRKPLADWAPFVKRAEDAILGTFFFVLSLPFYPIIAAFIKLESKGPVVFKQHRRGLNGKEIEVLKFRTMTVIETGSDVKQAAKNDPRITRVGAFLRRLSLDELPQLWNVVRGEMSLVGPRPHALVHDEEYSKIIEQYANRHQVKPGITGLAQVYGFRGETSTPGKMEGRIDMDIKYIDAWSLWLDLKIISRTWWVVLSGKNAH
ncbi:MAG: undecaprenyl-phosphate glucose phosphotransferase [Hyphomicrobiaceae bacterium]